MISQSVVPPEPGAPAPLVLRHAAPYAYDLGISPDSGPVAMVEERLPFSVRVVGDAEALHKAVYIRHAAYARHVPDLARNLQQPEAADFADGAVVLLAESHLDGSPLGTMRIQTNRYAPLALEESLPLPPELSGSLLAEATRRGVRRVLLEVAVDNAPAQRLYATYGFEPVGVRRGYYQPSNTDALVMQVELERANDG